MPKLTIKQNRLLAYPPNPGTWECSRCKMFNPEKRALCWACGEHQPRRPKRPTVWEQYLEACRIAGREPRIRHKEGTK